ncbi:MAG: TIGR02186 family protein [Pseudomonadota bacterium]
MPRLAFILLFALGALPAWGQAGLVSDLSERRIDIRTQFAGADLMLFGAIGRASGLDLGADFDIVAVVRGPQARALVRRKEPVLGVWVNRAAVLYQTAPGYFAMAATRPLEEVAGRDLMTIHQIGLDHLLLSPATPGGLSPSDMRAFRSGLIEHRAREGLYQTMTAPIEVLDDTLFRTRIRLPANVPTGLYRIDIYLFSQGRLVDQAYQELDVDKTGAERLIYTFAMRRPALYGVIAVVVALVAGWLAGFIYRKG